MKMFLLPCAAFALLNLQTGCESKPTGAFTPKHTTQFNAELKEKFVLMSADVQQSITCTGLKETMLADGRRQVDAQIQNLDNRRLQVQVQCEFKDDLGFTVDSTPWENLMLTENSIE